MPIDEYGGGGAGKDPALGAAALDQQAAALVDCRDCGLASGGRTQVVFGVGSPVADVLFVGEGPGFNEDKQGEPFVGQAGKLLTELLASIGFRREQVYIANVVKCRPPGNRDPEPDEIAACQTKLFAQIEVIRPRVICTLGRFATRLLAETTASMNVIRGKAKETEVAGVPVIVFPVFHPAAALYTPANRALLEEDFRKLRRLLDRGRGALAGVPDPNADRPPEPPAPALGDPAGSQAEADQLPLF